MVAYSPKVVEFGSFVVQKAEICVMLVEISTKIVLSMFYAIIRTMKYVLGELFSKNPNTFSNLVQI